MPKSVTKATHLRTVLSSPMPYTNLTENDLIDLIYQDRVGPLTTTPVLLEDYTKSCASLGIDPGFSIETLPDTTDAAATKWHMPEQYHSMDLEQYFAGLINTEEQAHRVAEELVLFKMHGLEPMLRFMIYMVQTMQKENIVWGVGRGSSVSSYLLFLIGLHLVDPIKYNLDIKEFIK